MDAGASWQSAQAALARRDIPEAQRQLRAVVDQQPAHAYARVMLAGTVLAQGRLREAVQQLQQAASLDYRDPALLLRVAQALLRVGDSEGVARLMRNACVARCNDSPTLAALAHVLQSLGLHADALQLMQRAAAVGFDSPDFHYFLGVQLQFNGELDAAEQALTRCLLLNPGHGRAALTRARLRRWRADDNHVDGLRRQLQTTATDSEDTAALWFALYKELEDLGDFPAAWDALRQGNTAMWRRLRHDRLADHAQHEAMARLAAAGTFAPIESADEEEGAQPIFIIGMPRSGTTVLERMLGNHSQVASAGELGDFAQQLRLAADQAGRALLDPALLQALPTLDYAAVGNGYLRQTRWRLVGQHRFIDKLPPNYLLAGPIARALPQAVIVYVRRDPMAVCFSNYRAMFGDSYAYSYELDALAAHHAAHTQLMQAWQQHLPGRVLEIDYEAMVRDPDAALVQVLQRCGLAPESGGSDLTRNAAATATLSSVQVREPVHARNIDEWQRYASELAPLRERLQKGR